MKYRIVGDTMPAVEIMFDSKGESVFTQSGGMTWMSDGIAMATNTRGGLMKGIGRMFAGESLFMATYTAQRPGALIAFASTVAGQIYPLDVSATGGLICQKGAFLCAQDSVNVNISFTKKISSGFFGGEGFILQDISGQGIAFLEVDGDLVEKQLAPGEILKVDTGNVVAFDRSVRYEIETVKGLGNIFFGGEGLFLTKLTGRNPGFFIILFCSFFFRWKNYWKFTGEHQKYEERKAILSNPNRLFLAFHTGSHNCYLHNHRILCLCP